MGLRFSLPSVGARLGLLQQTPYIRHGDVPPLQTSPTAVRPQQPRFTGPSPFGLLMKEQMKGLVAQGQKVSEAMKTISAIWKQLGQDGKQHYMDQSRKQRAQLQDDFQKLSEEQKNDLLQKRAEKLEKRSQNRRKRNLNKFNSQTNRPKKPMSSFLLFRADLSKKRTAPFSTRKEANKFAIEDGEKWRNLSAEERQPFVEYANLMMVAYRQNLDIWKSQNAEKIQEFREKTKKNRSK